MRNTWRRSPWIGPAMMVVVALVLAGCAGSAGPKLAVDQAVLDFGAEEHTLTLHVENAGGGSLTWAVEADADWILVTPSGGEGSGAVTVTVDRGGLRDGEYSAALTVTSNGGAASVAVSLIVGKGALPEPTPGRVPGQVTGLHARGFTLPVGVVPAPAENPSAAAARLIALTDVVVVGPSGASDGVAPAAGSMPVGFEGFFVLSWDVELEATAYRVLMNVDGHWRSVADVPVDALDNPWEPTYVVRGDYDVGATAAFMVQALNGREVGPPSEADDASIIAPQNLKTPADGSDAPGAPTFAWREHPVAIGYVLYVATEDGNLWIQVLEDGDATERTYPGDDEGPGKELEAGTYSWFVLAQGPLGDDEQPKGYALSPKWAFHVR